MSTIEPIQSFIDAQERMVMADTVLSYSFAFLLTILLVFVLTRPCKNGLRFSNSLKLIGGYICMLLFFLL